jgi:hypothetical protein
VTIVRRVVDNLYRICNLFKLHGACMRNKLESQEETRSLGRCLLSAPPYSAPPEIWRTDQ